MRHVAGHYGPALRVFQSTHSLARMRQRYIFKLSGNRIFQSTHSLARMRRPAEQLKRQPRTYFNPRIPSQECDLFLACILSPLSNFNPRIPSQECDSNHYQKSLLIPSISYPYCTPPLSKTQPLYFHRAIFSHKSPIFQCESSYIFMFT